MRVQTAIHVLMAAYHLRPLEQRQCGYPSCMRTATKELRNWQNAIISWYCARHGDVELRRLLKDAERHD